MGANPRVVNIIGRAPSAAIKPPFGELWVINNGWNYGHKPDKWFCMDGLNHVIQAASGEGIPEDRMIDFVKANPTMEVYSPVPEELTIDGAFDETKNIKELSTLLREGKMKEFY
jgi:hypothetical protein